MPTVAFSTVSENDVWIRRTGVAYPPAGTIIVDPTTNDLGYISKNLSDFEVSHSLFRWDTSSLPDDAAISSAQLRIESLAGGIRHLRRWVPGCP